MLCPEKEAELDEASSLYFRLLRQESACPRIEGLPALNGIFGKIAPKNQSYKGKLRHLKPDKRIQETYMM
jgi:hypothetical protein